MDAQLIQVGLAPQKERERKPRERKPKEPAEVEPGVEPKSNAARNARDKARYAAKVAASGKTVKEYKARKPKEPKEPEPEEEPVKRKPKGRVLTKAQLKEIDRLGRMLTEDELKKIAHKEMIELRAAVYDAAQEEKRRAREFFSSH